MIGQIAVGTLLSLTSARAASSPTMSFAFSIISFHRDTGQGHPITPGGQRDVQNSRRQLGIVKKHLVEIAHPEKQDLVAVSSAGRSPGIAAWSSPTT